MSKNYGARNSVTWLLILDGKSIGELTNANIDIQSDSWSEFDLAIYLPEYNQLMKDPEYWYGMQISLQDKVTTHIIVSDYLVAIRENNRVAIKILPG